MIVAVINVKGGVGKTTTALGLATAAAREGLSPVVWDADEQSSASMWAYDAEEAGDPLPFGVRSANRADLRRLKASRPSGLVVVDTPATGRVTDAARECADFVVVPTSPTGVDLQQTIPVARTLEDSRTPYAVLVVKAEARTLALQAARTALAGLRTFRTEIPKRADLGNLYGQSFGADLYGYGEAWAEIREALA